MKKYFIVLFIVALTACSEDFLNRTPTDSKVESEFYKTPADAYEGLVAVYDALQIDYDGFTNYILISEIVSDNCFSGGGSGDAENWLDTFGKKYDQFAPIWRKYYQGIYRANVILSKLDGVDWGTDAGVAVRYEAEARFLRAYFYLDLVRMFGNIPLVTTPLNADEYYVPQASAEDVYKQIAEDLQFAIDNLDDIPYSQIPNAEYGRVTKWAAIGLLARAYLFYTDYYEKPDLAGIYTRAQVRDLVDNMIQASGHGLVEDFTHLWRAASTTDFVGEDNKETVWTIKYTYKAFGDGNKMDGSRWQVMIGLRNQIHVPYGMGWGAGTVSPQLWNAYNSADKRKKASIIATTPTSQGGEGFVATAPDQRQYTGYFWKKFAPYATSSSNNESVDLGGDYQLDNFEDYPSIRFADVLLMGAELHLDGGDLTKAQSYFDQVRKRAYGVTDGTITEQDYITNGYGITLGGNAKAVIMTERRLELALEGHRYYDLIRQSMDVAEQAINYSNGDLTATFNPKTNGFLEIPETQINLSRNTLIQNSGWE